MMFISSIQYIIRSFLLGDIFRTNFVNFQFCSLSLIGHNSKDPQPHILFDVNTMYLDDRRRERHNSRA